MEKSFSFLELMVVVVIVGIMTTLAMPSYAKYTEKSRGRNAEANLMIIYNMEKRFKLDNSSYYECATAPCYTCTVSPCAGCPATPCTIQRINDNLGVFIRDPYFTYNIEQVGTNDYKATATKVGSGLCSGRTMTISGSNKTLVKGCSIW